MNLIAALLGGVLAVALLGPQETATTAAELNPKAVNRNFR
jgi:hypothetical protein